MLSPNSACQREPAAVDCRWAEGWKPQRLLITCLEYLHRSHIWTSSATLQASKTPCSILETCLFLLAAKMVGRDKTTGGHVVHYIFILNIWLCTKNLINTIQYSSPLLHMTPLMWQQIIAWTACLCACTSAPVQVANEWSSFDPATDHVVAGGMTTLIEWLLEYFNEVTLPHQIMKNSCYKSGLVWTAFKNFIYCLIFLLASSAGTIVWLEEKQMRTLMCTQTHTHT